MRVLTDNGISQSEYHILILLFYNVLSDWLAKNLKIGGYKSLNRYKVDIPDPSMHGKICLSPQGRSVAAMSYYHCHLQDMFPPFLNKYKHSALGFKA